MTQTKNYFNILIYDNQSIDYYSQFLGLKNANIILCLKIINFPVRIYTILSTISDGGDCQTHRLVYIK